MTMCTTFSVEISHDLTYVFRNYSHFIQSFTSFKSKVHLCEQHFNLIGTVKSCKLAVTDKRSDLEKLVFEQLLLKIKFTTKNMKNDYWYKMDTPIINSPDKIIPTIILYLIHLGRLITIGKNLKVDIMKIFEPQLFLPCEIKLLGWDKNINWESWQDKIESLECFMALDYEQKITTINLEWLIWMNEFYYSSTSFYSNNVQVRKS